MSRRGRTHVGTQAAAAIAGLCILFAAPMPLSSQPEARSSFAERFSVGERSEPVFARPETQRILSLLPSWVSAGEAMASWEAGTEEPPAQAPDAVSIPTLAAGAPGEGQGIRFEEWFAATERGEPAFADPGVQEVIAMLPPWAGADETVASAPAEAEAEPAQEGIAPVPAMTAEAPAQQEQDMDRIPAIPAEPPGEIARPQDAAPAPDWPPPAEVPAVAEAPEAAREEGVEHPQQPETTASVATGRRIGSGRAAWYEHPGRTASGEVFDPDQFTAAHYTLPFGTRVRVVNEDTGRSVVVRINDRLPSRAAKRFIIDLSRASARAIGMRGVAQVSLYYDADRSATAPPRDLADRE